MITRVPVSEVKGGTTSLLLMTLTQTLDGVPQGDVTDKKEQTPRYIWRKIRCRFSFFPVRTVKHLFSISSAGTQEIIRTKQTSLPFAPHCCIKQKL